MQDEHSECTGGAEFRSPGLIEEDVPPSALQEKGATMSKPNILGQLYGSIMIRNETGGPIIVYYRPAAKRVARRRALGFNIVAGMSGLAGVGAQHAAEYEQMQYDINSSTIIDPPTRNAARQSNSIDVIGPTIVSIQRMSTDGTTLDQWDCVDVLVKPGRKLIVGGTAQRLV